MYRIKHIGVLVLSMVSGIDWRSWNLSPKDEEELLYLTWLALIPSSFHTFIPKTTKDELYHRYREIIPKVTRLGVGLLGE